VPEHFGDDGDSRDPMVRRIFVLIHGADAPFLSAHLLQWEPIACNIKASAKTLGKTLIPFQKKKKSRSGIWGFGGGFLFGDCLFICNAKKPLLLIANQAE
jgi:hypothetical protein